MNSRCKSLERRNIILVTFFVWEIFAFTEAKVLKHMLQTMVPVLNQVPRLHECGLVWWMKVDNKMLCPQDDHISYIHLCCHVVWCPSMKFNVFSTGKILPFVIYNMLMSFYFILMLTGNWQGFPFTFNDDECGYRSSCSQVVSSKQNLKINYYIILFILLHLPDWLLLCVKHFSPLPQLNLNIVFTVWHWSVIPKACQMFIMLVRWLLYNIVW
jgi:hypothetical protein